MCSADGRWAGEFDASGSPAYVGAVGIPVSCWYWGGIDPWRGVVYGYAPRYQQWWQVRLFWKPLGVWSPTFHLELLGHMTYAYWQVVKAQRALFPVTEWPEPPDP